MAKKDDTKIETSPSEIEALITRFERNELTAEDRALNVRLLRLVLTFVSVLERKNFTISRLRRMLVGPSSDTRSAKAQASDGESKSGSEKRQAEAFGGAQGNRLDTTIPWGRAERLT